MRSTRRVYAVIGLLMFGVASSISAQDATESAQPPAEDEADEVKTVELPPINSGFVILDGHYIATPYVLRQRGEEAWINDQPVEILRLTRLWPGRERGRGGWGGRMPGGPGGEGQEQRQPWGGPRGNWGGPRGNWGRPGEYWPDGPRGFSAPMLHHARRQLESGGMVILFEDSSQEFEEFDSLYLLNILLGDTSDESKMEKILDWKENRLKPHEWRAIVSGFQPTSELTERVSPLMEKYRPVWEKNEAAHEALMRSEVFRSKPVQYSITVLAMGLAVVAVGTLLTYRPSPNGRWRDIDDAKERVTMVVRNVSLLAALSGIDLFLTLVAQQGGGFLEMNPLASHLVESPMLLGVFKLSGLAVACLILISLRRYRGAQVASWWLCLLCTILTFRWLTYNSLFFS